MSYAFIENFRGGLDVRKLPISGVPGTLVELTNGHITRGGDIERRKKFVSTYTLPAGNTFGLIGIVGTLYTFGSSANPGTIPAGITYKRCAHADGVTAMNGVLFAEAFNGKPYVIASFADGNIYHYFDGARVTGWDSIAASVANNSNVAAALAAKIGADPMYTATAVGAVVTVTAAVAGTPFALSAAAQNYGTVNDQTITLAQVQANRAAVAEVLGTCRFDIVGGTNVPGTNRITSVKIDGVEVLGASVDWATSNSATASAIAAQVNTFISAPDYTATAAGATVIISAKAGTGASVNGFTLSSTEAGNMAVGNAESMSGGVTATSAMPQISTATIGGTFETADVFTVTIDGKNFTVSGGSSGTGKTAMTYKSKMYSTATSLLYYSAINTPASPGSGTGGGFINMATQDGGSQQLTAMGVYQGYAAIFSRFAVQLWSLNQDDTKNAQIQVLRNTGTQCPRSVLTYGNNDTFYLADSGIRSLRARDASNAAFTNDVGSAIDPLVLADLSALTPAQVQAAVAVMEPIDGRYWLAVGSRIYVLSYFLGAAISAWSVYDVGMQISDFAIVTNRVYARSADTIYLYGGPDNNTYPGGSGEAPLTVQLPFITGGKPASFKDLIGFDTAVEAGTGGFWQVSVRINPNDPNEVLPIGNLYQPTYPNSRVAMVGRTTHFAPRFIYDAPGYALLSSLAVHFTTTEEEG